MGRFKVTYIFPDKKCIGNDRFDTIEEAKKYAKALRKAGYHDVEISETDGL